MCVIGPKLSRCRAGIAFSITQELTAHLCSGGMPKCSGGHADGCLRVMDEVGLTILGYIRECQRRIADGLWWQNWSSFSLFCRLLRLASDLKNGYKLCLLPVCQLSSFAHLWCSMFNGFDLCINFGHYLLEPFEFFFARCVTPVFGCLSEDLWGCSYNSEPIKCNCSRVFSWNASWNSVSSAHEKVVDKRKVFVIKGFALIGFRSLLQGYHWFVWLSASRVQKDVVLISYGWILLWTSIISASVARFGLGGWFIIQWCCWSAHGWIRGKKPIHA